MKYLVIQLDDTSTSYCHYGNVRSERKLISLPDLRRGIVFAMKEAMMVQFVYPAYELPSEYKRLIHSVGHSAVVPSSCEDEELLGHADVVVFNGWDGVASFGFRENSVCVIRTGRHDLFGNYRSLREILPVAARVNIAMTDVESFTDEDFGRYEEVLKDLSDDLERLYVNGRYPQVNLLTDRMLLMAMNNCDAGVENVTLAPDGQFYVCPAFYLAGDDEDYGPGKTKFSIGDLENGLDIKNPQLYNLSHAPICRNCDAYQCKRCVWLNRRTTYELNTPGHEQCVVSHLERNAGRKLLANIREHMAYLPQQEIRTIDYLDPFEVGKY